MSIEGLKSTSIIPVIKKDRETDANQRKKKNMGQKKERKEEDDKHNKNKGKVDIRI